VVSLFLRMNEETCRRLIAAHDVAWPALLPQTFLYFRRLTGVMLGAGFVSLARQTGHDGTGAPETLDAAPTLGDVYRKMQTGDLSLGTSEGRWEFGLALISEAHALGSSSVAP
jgi:hypothetical protein